MVFQKGEKNPRWNGGIRKNQDGYRLILKSEHPYSQYEGYVLEHRLVVEEYYTNKWGIKFYLHPSVHVHHVNKIIDDNRIENLKLLTRGQHTALHNLRDMTNRICSRCDRSYEELKKQIKGYDHWSTNPNDKTKWMCKSCNTYFSNKRKRERKKNGR